MQKKTFWPRMWLVRIETVRFAYSLSMNLTTYRLWRCWDTTILLSSVPTYSPTHLPCSHVKSHLAIDATRATMMVDGEFYVLGTVPTCKVQDLGIQQPSHTMADVSLTRRPRYVNRLARVHPKNVLSLVHKVAIRPFIIETVTKTVSPDTVSISRPAGTTSASD